MNRLILLVALVLAMVSGCGAPTLDGTSEPTLDCTSDETLNTSMDAIADGLSEAKKNELGDAILRAALPGDMGDAFSGATAETFTESKQDPAKASDHLKRFHGMTADQIIASSKKVIEPQITQAER